jgi:hypothetical protein
MTQERISSQEYRRRMGLTATAPATTTKAKPQIRIPAPRKQTKTEMECERLLQSIYPPSFFEVLYEPWSFKLPSGLRYSPDFVVMDGAKIVEVTESKGSRILNHHTIRAFKEAKAAFPQFNFVLRQKRDGQWTSTEPTV